MFQLEPNRPYHLERAPLAQALAQVRYPIVARLQTLEGIAPIQDRLHDLFPFMERRETTELAILVGPGGPSEPQVGSTSAWELSDDLGNLVSVAPGIATLSAGETYQGVAWFSERFEALLNALASEVGIRRCDRLGVRYLSLAESPPGEERAWNGWFRPELTGWMGGGVLADETEVQNSITQTALLSPPTGELALLPSEAQAVIRHGLVQGGGTVPGIPPVTLEREVFLLDLDLFVAFGQSFDPDALVEQFRSLHSQIDRFFRWTLTEAGESYFGLEELDS